MTAILAAAGWIALATAAVPVYGQQSEPDAAATTRAGAISQQQAAKSTALKPETPSRPEEVFDEIANRELVRRLAGTYPGLRMKWGGLPAGAGFSAGPEYYRPDLLNDEMVFRAFAQGSPRAFYSIGSGVEFPKLFSYRFALKLEAYHNDAPSLRYFGPGPTSTRSERTNYRFEETTFNYVGGLRPLGRRLFVGFDGGLHWFNVGPGTDDLHPSAETRFTPAQAPGINEQTNFTHAGAMVRFSNLDRPGDPHLGSDLYARFAGYHDLDLKRYNFSRLEIGATQYIPLANAKRVIVLHGETDLTYTNGINRVPFYLQPSLGGPQKLRGFSQFRFTDNNALLVSGEYRWEIFPGLDMAMFTDAGNVFTKRGDFGFRLKSRDAVAIRLDLAASREGFLIWFTTSNIFSR